jgi:hypothetical protein
MRYVLGLVLLLGLVMIILASFSMGCSEGPKHEEKDPFKARQEAQKEKNQEKFMKPRGMPSGPKGQ